MVLIADQREIGRLDLLQPLGRVDARLRVIRHTLGDLEPRAVVRLARELALQHVELVLVDVFKELKNKGQSFSCRTELKASQRPSSDFKKNYKQRPFHQPCRTHIPATVVLTGLEIQKTEPGSRPDSCRKIF